jgi:hypothetical protein
MLRLPDSLEEDLLCPLDRKLVGLGEGLDIVERHHVFPCQESSPDTKTVNL